MSQIICPNCGCEIFDGVSVCPNCKKTIEGNIPQEKIYYSGLISGIYYKITPSSWNIGYTTIQVQEISGFQIYTKQGKISKGVCIFWSCFFFICSFLGVCTLRSGWHSFLFAPIIVLFLILGFFFKSRASATFEQIHVVLSSGKTVSFPKSSVKRNDKIKFKQLQVAVLECLKENSKEF